MLLIFSSNLASGGAPPPSVQTQIAIAASWATQPQDSVAPVIPAKLPPALISVDNPPPLEVVQDERPWDNWWVPSDPAPQLTVKLSRGPPVNNPPFGIPPLSARAILEAWQPPPAQAPVADTLNPTIFVPVNNPPGGFPEISSTAVQTAWQWQPPPPQAPIAGIFNPAITVIPPPSQPPYGVPVPSVLEAILTAWTPPDAQAPVAGNLNPSISAVQVNNPPVPLIAAVSAGGISWPSLPDPPPILPRKFNHALFADLGKPSGNSVLSGVFNSWVGEPWPIMWVQADPAILAAPFNLYPGLIPNQGVFGSFGGDEPSAIMWVQAAPVILDVPANNPPFSNQGNVPQSLVNTLASWQPADPEPISSEFAIPASPAPANPVSRGTRNTVLSSWVQPDPAPIFAGTPPILAGPGAALLPSAQFVPSGPPDTTGILSAWADFPPAPIVARSLNPAFQAISNAPGRRPDRLSSILWSWVPSDPAPIVASSLNPTISAAAVNNPPFSGSATTTPALIEILAWVPADVAIPPPLPRILPPPPPPPSYIPTRRSAISTVVASWIVADQAPTKPPFVPQVQVAVATAFVASSNSASAATIVNAWAPDFVPPIVPRPLQVQGAAPMAATPTAMAFEAIIGSWAELPSPPIVGSKLTFSPPRTDPPPVATKTLAQSGVVDQWLAPTGLLPILPDLGSPAYLAVEVDNPPLVGSYLNNMTTVLTTWTPSPYDPWFTATSLSYSAPPPPQPPGRSIFEALGMSQEGSALRSGIGQISTS